MKIFICVSDGQDPYTTEIWRAYTKKKDAKQWVKEVKERDDIWNKSNFDEKIRKECEKELILYGIVNKDGKYDGNYGGSPYYIETELCRIEENPQ